MTDLDALLSILDVRSGVDSDHDPYSALCALFDVANALYWLDANAVPADWQFGMSPLGGLDYAACTWADESECSAHPSGECYQACALLYALNVVMADPFGDESGLAAERALIELGNVLNLAASRYDG